MKLKTMNKLFLITSLLTISPTVSKAESVYMCEPCPAGYSCNNGIKSPCPAGTYSSAVSTSCSPCTGNTYSNEGASSCTACASGSIANSSHTTCLKSCRYSFSTDDCSCKTCIVTRRNDHIVCEDYYRYTKKGKPYKPYDCKSCLNSDGAKFSPVYYFDITLEHGDSAYGRTCDNGVLK